MMDLPFIGKRGLEIQRNPIPRNFGGRSGLLVRDISLGLASISGNFFPSSGMLTFLWSEILGRQTQMATVYVTLNCVNPLEIHSQS